MNTRSHLQTKPKSSFIPVQSGLLQRKCACGDSAGLTGKCNGCQKKRLNIQRRAANQAETNEVPPIVHEVLREPGQPLDTNTRALMESRFGDRVSQKHTTTTSSTIQSQLTVSQPEDIAEQEAEQVADAVTNRFFPSTKESRTVSESKPSHQNFSQVQVHTNTKAAEAARAMNSEAFTLKQHIVFGAGRYAPHTRQGQHLLAHELTHYIQQQTTTPQLQRRLSVNPNHPTFAPATDPAASLSSAQRFTMMNSLIQSLCDEFEVNSTTGEVQPTSLQTLDPSVLVAGNKPTGCCCLNILTDSLAANWTIEVSQVVGPRTLPASRQVVLSPTTTPVEFGSFTASGSLAFQGDVPAAGHELCGHAALMEISAHPPLQDRSTTDVHDPTVRIENLISTEQGVPSSELRGLAASGVHRGESVDRITIRNYPFNASDIPSSEQSKIRFAADYIIQNTSFVDILGHSDNVGSVAGKQNVSTLRAQKVQQALAGRGVPANQFTSVQGVSDSQPPPPPLRANQNNWRRVDILMAGFPAGSQRPPAGTPTVVNPHVQSPNVPALKSSANPCIRHLVRGGYP